MVPDKDGDAAAKTGTAAAVRERTPRPRGTALLFGVGAVLLGGAGMGVFLWATGENGGLRERAYAVTYEVTGSGTVTVEYTAARAAGKPATRAASVELPWSKEVSVTRAGGRPTLTVTLGEHGGEAACAVTVEGEKLRGAAVDGPRGQATCFGEPPDG